MPAASSRAGSPRPTDLRHLELTEVLRHLEVSDSSWHRWRAQYRGMKSDEVKRLRELERENARLKKIVADKSLEIDMLKELAEGNF